MWKLSTVLVKLCLYCCICCIRYKFQEEKIAVWYFLEKYLWMTCLLTFGMNFAVCERIQIFSSLREILYWPSQPVLKCYRTAICIWNISISGILSNLFPQKYLFYMTVSVSSYLQFDNYLVDKLVMSQQCVLACVLH